MVCRAKKMLEEALNAPERKYNKKTKKQSKCKESS